MEAIKDTVMSVMQHLADKKLIAGSNEPQLVLRKALTKKELGHIKVNYFKKGILSVNVDSSSWLYSLTLKKETLLAKLGRKSKEIKDIRFRIGEVK
jgi:hypothetical protein